VIKVVISRKRWGRGPTGGYLRSPIVPVGQDKPTGLQCCLGFICEMAGIFTEEVTSDGFPDTLVRERWSRGELPWGTIPEVLQPLLSVESVGDSHWIKSKGVDANGVDTLVHINDDKDLPDDIREARLIEAAGELGYEFVFVD
jgi:hypothetical protein